MTDTELYRAIARVMAIKDQGQLPQDVSPWFVHCTLAALINGAQLPEMHQSFLEAQPDVSERVNATFKWLEEQLNKKG